MQNHRIEVKITSPDYLRFNLQHSFRPQYTVLYLASCAVLSFIMLGDVPPESKLFLVPLMSICATAVFIAVTAGITVLRTSFIFKRDPALSQPYSLTLTDTAIVEESPSSRIEVEYTKVYRVVRKVHLFAVYIAPIKAFLVPVRPENLAFIHEAEQRIGAAMSAK